MVETPPKYTLPTEKPLKTPKSATGAYGSASSDRPYACPYEGCEKAYIHEYKLNLHLRREHPSHFKDETPKNAQSTAENEIDEGSDQDAYAGKRGNDKTQKQNKPKPSLKLPPAKAQRRSSNASAANVNVVKKPWPVKEEVYDEEDSEETEEERDNVGDGWRFAENEEDDEETEYED